MIWTFPGLMQELQSLLSFPSNSLKLPLALALQGKLTRFAVQPQREMPL